MAATTTTVTFYATASTTNLVWRRPVLRPAVKPGPPIRRDFPRDWYEALRGAYEEIKGDAPPKRLNQERRRLMFAVHRVLRTTAVWQQREKAEGR